jgi:hypothetical protein
MTMTRFQRTNLWIGLAALALVGCMAISQTQESLRAEDGGSPALQAFQ